MKSRRDVGGFFLLTMPYNSSYKYEQIEILIMRFYSDGKCTYPFRILPRFVIIFHT